MLGIGFKTVLPMTEVVAPFGIAKLFSTPSATRGRIARLLALAR